MTSHELDPRVMQQRHVAYLEDPVIHRAVSVARSYAVSPVILVKKKDATKVVRPTASYRQYMHDRISAFAQFAFVEYIVQGLVIVAFDEVEDDGGEPALTPVLVPATECGLQYVITDKQTFFIEASRHPYRDPESLHVYVFGSYNLEERCVYSRVGALILPHNEYHNITTSVMACAARASKTPLVLQRTGMGRGEGAGYVPPVDLSIYNALTGELDSDLTNATQVIQESAYRAQQKLMTLMDVQENIMETMRKNKIDPSDPTFGGGVSRMTLPPDTQVARVEYPNPPYTPEVMYARYVDIVFGIIGISAAMRTTDKRTFGADRLGLGQSTRVEYHTDMNRFLRHLHSELIARSGGDPVSHGHTFNLGPPQVEFQEIMQLSDLPYVDKMDIRELLEKSLGFSLRDFVEPEEGEVKGKAADKKKPKKKEGEKKKKGDQEKEKKKKGAGTAAGKKTAEDTKSEGDAKPPQSKADSDKEGEPKKEKEGEGKEEDGAKKDKGDTKASEEEKKAKKKTPKKKPEASKGAKKRKTPAKKKKPQHRRDSSSDGSSSESGSGSGSSSESESESEGETKPASRKKKAPSSSSSSSSDEGEPKKKKSKKAVGKSKE